MNKKIDIKKTYEDEVRKIYNKLQKIKDYHYYEHTNDKSDGRLSTNIDQLREMFDDLINKIEYRKESDESITDEIFTNKNDC
jgi:hypothetical protein